jgi:hypothetical protein
MITWHWITEQWPCISSVGAIGFFLGLLTTRYLMAPAYCPRCLRRNEWVNDLKGEKKEQSRRFYHMRRGDKDEK